MSRNWNVSLVFGLLATALVLSARGQEQHTVLQYLSERATELVSAASPVAGARDAWEIDRATLLEQIRAELDLPDRQPMRTAILAERTDGDLRIEEVAFLWSGDVAVSATVIRSVQATSPQPAVVITSGLLGHYTRSSHRPLIQTLARCGHVVLSLDDPRIGRRHAAHAGLYAAAGATGTSIAGIQVFDALRGLDYLCTRSDVDPGRIGILGIDQGALQAYLAAALEPRFQFVIAVGGTTTYQALVRAAADGQPSADPSADIAGLLKIADMDRVAACVAPRPLLVVSGAGRTWPVQGRMKMLHAIESVYALYDASEQLDQLRGDQAGEETAAEIVAWLDGVVGKLDSSAAPISAAPADTYEEVPQFSMLEYLQGRVNDLAENLPTDPTSLEQWQTYRATMLTWLRAACDVDRLQPAADQLIQQETGDDLVTERWALGIDGAFHCPAVLVRPAADATSKSGAVILSHGDRQCAASPHIAAAAAGLAAQGYWVLVPDHASVHPDSLQCLGDAASPSFYGDEAATLYGPADVVGMPPLALRMIENLAAFRHLTTRSEVDPQRIVIAGTGIGGLDAGLAAALEERIAGVTAIDVTTMRDWTQQVAPEQLHFFHLMPYLPGGLERTDFDLLLAASAPRPLCLSWLKDGWPRSGFEQCAATAGKVYRLLQADQALLAVDPRQVTDEFTAGLPDGVQRQLGAVARVLLPTPPQPGLVGNLPGMCSRGSVDSAAGLIWIVAEMDGYDQEFVDSGYRLRSWSFFNDNGGAQQGRALTPLIFQRQGEGYELIGIGAARTNTGSGLQKFAWEPVAGTDAVGEGCYFGWHTGQVDGSKNPGVIEYDSVTDCRMVILTADGQMGGQRLQLGATYREQAVFPRRYSVMAVAEKE
jgi:dienelactone hydrolase